MKKRVISVFAVILLCAFTILGTKVSASEKGLWFVFTSFGEIEKVELINMDDDITIQLGSDELFDFETYDFIDSQTNNIRVIKTYMDGTVVDQIFKVDNASTIVGIYDDGVCGESWIEIDGNCIY